MHFLQYCLSTQAITMSSNQFPKRTLMISMSYNACACCGLMANVSIIDCYRNKGSKYRFYWQSAALEKRIPTKLIMISSCLLS